MPHTNDPTNVTKPDKCERPTCTSPPQRTYTGENGNELQLCRDCYYRLVSRQSATPSIATDRPVTTDFDLGFTGRSTASETSPSPPAPSTPDPLRPPHPHDGGDTTGDDG